MLDRLLSLSDIKNDLAFSMVLKYGLLLIF
jgi:hypothetical protein